MEIPNLLVPELAAYVGYIAAMTWGLVECFKPAPFLPSWSYRMLACGFGVLSALLVYLAVTGHPWAGIIALGLGVATVTTGAEKWRQAMRDKPAAEPSEQERLLAELRELVQDRAVLPEAPPPDRE